MVALLRAVHKHLQSKRGARIAADPQGSILCDARAPVWSGSRTSCAGTCSEIEGVCRICTADLQAAADALKRALVLLEERGLEMEMEMVVCELCTSVAQRMSMQHRKWVAGRKDRLRDEAALWLGTEQGKREIRSQTNKILWRQTSPRPSRRGRSSGG